MCNLKPLTINNVRSKLLSLCRYKLFTASKNLIVISVQTNMVLSYKLSIMLPINICSNLPIWYNVYLLSPFCSLWFQPSSGGSTQHVVSLSTQLCIIQLDCYSALKTTLIIQQMKKVNLLYCVVSNGMLTVTPIQQFKQTSTLHWKHHAGTENYSLWFLEQWLLLAEI